MKKFFKNVLILLILTSITFFPLEARAENGIMIGNIEKATVGSYISLGGKVWRLIGDNYIILNEPVTTMAYGKNNYVSYGGSDIRNYLNNDFLNSLGSAKRLVSYYDWGIGTETFEDSTTINDKISLPSYRDIEAIKDLVPKNNGTIWTRTQVDNSKVAYKFWCFDTKTSSIIQQPYSNKSAVYPVLIIAPDMVVTGKGTQKSPYVISETPGQTDKTRVEAVKLSSLNINIKAGEIYNLVPLLNYTDGTLKQIVNPNKYLYDKSLGSRTSAPKYEVIVTGDKITYSSSNTDVVEVNSMGYVVAKKSGVASITVKGLGWVAKGVVTVK